jgi:hypothetical protein
MKSIYLSILLLTTSINYIIAQSFTELLGRPTDSTITMNILFDQQTEVYWEYGTATGTYSYTTPKFVADKDVPLEADFTNLLANIKYYYRTRYRLNGATTSFLTGPEHVFQTPRPEGTTFTFAIEADPHLDTNSSPASYTLTLQNIFSKKPDFLIDLGDIFMSEKLPVKTQTEITKRHVLYRPYFNEVCHSVPLYLVLGNHEGELGWLLNSTANSLPVLTTNTRKQYYPNPFPNTFYSGNTKIENYVGLRENYYSWEWGDALFIVLDPFWYTLTKPGWGWTLGVEQYNWFKNILTSSHSKYKFVFCHNLVGGDGNDARGGTEFVDLFEMGGNNLDSTYGFDTNRPGWGKSIHSLMVENKVNVFFHGHDHFYGKQDKDGIVYQEVPQPSIKNITNLTASKYGYVNGVLLPGRGFILVTVSDTSTKVDYIWTYLSSEENANHKNGELAHSYTLKSPVLAVDPKCKPTSSFYLGQNYPNPFSSVTSINYKISSANNVQLKVFDVYGKEVVTLVNKNQKTGNYIISFNSNELSIPNGIYYYRLTVGNYSETMKMIFYK